MMRWECKLRQTHVVIAFVQCQDVRKTGIGKKSFLNDLIQQACPLEAMKVSSHDFSKSLSHSLQRTFLCVTILNFTESSKFLASAPFMSFVLTYVQRIDRYEVFRLSITHVVEKVWLVMPAQLYISILWHPSTESTVRHTEMTFTNQYNQANHTDIKEYSCLQML
jgi:hypothetical protein